MNEIEITISGDETSDKRSALRTIARALVAAGWDVHAEDQHFQPVLSCEQGSSVGHAHLKVEE